MSNVPSHVSQGDIDEMNRIAKERYGVSDETPEVEQQVEQVEQVEPQVEPPVEESELNKSSSVKEENIQILRARTERAEHDRDELIRTIQELKSQNNNKQVNKQVGDIKEDLDDIILNPDDLAEGKHLNKLRNEIKKLEQKFNESEQRSRHTTDEMRIKRDFPDFEEVASVDNLKKLRAADPDLAEAILAISGDYKQHALAYKMVKQMGIHVKDTYGKDRDVVIKNSAKPRPLTAISPQQGDSPLSKANAFANGLTEDLKKQLYREMIEAQNNG